MSKSELPLVRPSTPPGEPRSEASSLQVETSPRHDDRTKRFSLRAVGSKLRAKLAPSRPEVSLSDYAAVRTRSSDSDHQPSVGFRLENSKSVQMPQREAFRSEEGDRWFERNMAAFDSTSDPVLKALEDLEMKPKSVLEVGCSNGYRLDQIAKTRGAKVVGLEPSSIAIDDGRARFPEVELHVGTADDLPFESNKFDLVIFGCCLCLVDPALHFRCVAEADRVLADGGYVAVFDFLSNSPYANEWHHAPNLRCHKMEFSRYFSANPAYILVHRVLRHHHQPDERLGVDILVKNLGNAFPVNSARHSGSRGLVSRSTA